MILLIDNYDSFVYNLARYAGELGHDRHVVRNDGITIAEIERMAPSAIILSPGPCAPAQAGMCRAIVRQLGQKIPILGVCLGHQVIAEVFGGTVRRALHPRHGKSAEILHAGAGIFSNLPSPLRVGLYHSLAVDVAEGGALEVTARSDDGEIMGMAHRHAPVFGVQFHPESILTQSGHALLANFFRLAGEWNAQHRRDVT